MAQKIWIGCKLPSGLTIFDPTDRDRLHPIHLKGTKHSVIKGAQYGLTQVDSETWTLFKNCHPDYKPIRSGAVFEVGNDEKDGERAFADVAKEKTGFEKVSQIGQNIKPDNGKD